MLTGFGKGLLAGGLATTAAGVFIADNARPVESSGTKEQIIENWICD